MESHTNLTWGILPGVNPPHPHDRQNVWPPPPCGPPSGLKRVILFNFYSIDCMHKNPVKRGLVA